MYRTHFKVVLKLELSKHKGHNLYNLTVGIGWFYFKPLAGISTY